MLYVFADILLRIVIRISTMTIMIWMDLIKHYVQSMIKLIICYEQEEIYFLILIHRGRLKTIFTFLIF